MTADLVKRPDGDVATQRPPNAKPRQTIVGTLVRRPAAAVVAVRRSERTKTVIRYAGPPVKWTARSLWFTLQGYRLWAKSVWDGVTHGARHEQLRIARALHNLEGVKEALDDLKTDKKIRAALLKDLPGILAGLVGALAGAVAFVAFVLFALGLAIQLTPGGWGWSDWWSAVGATIEAIGNVLYLLVVVALWSALPLLLILGYATGRKSATPPRWARTSADVDLDITIDERTVTQALDALRIPQIRDHLKAGGHLQWYYLNPSHENDQVTPLIERSLDAIARAGKVVPGTGVRPLAVQRNLLEDLDGVLGDEPVRTADIPALPAAYVPGWPPYKTMTGKSLRELLRRDYGIKVASTGNKWPLDPVAVRAESARRATADLDALEGSDEA